MSWMQYANTQAFPEQMLNWRSLTQEVMSASCTPVQDTVEDISIQNVLVGVPMRMYGVRDTNFVEGQNGVFAKKGFRDCLPYKSLCHYHEFMVNQAFECNEQAKLWVEQKCVLTDYAQKVYASEKLKTGRCDANRVSITDDLEHLTVWDTYDPSIQFSLNVKEVTCQCIMYDQLGIVCRHLIFAMHLCQRKFNVYEHFDSCYLVSTYANAFQLKCITPVMPQDVLCVKGVQPPLLYAQCGRPKGRGCPPKRRITSNGEASNSNTHKATCSICRLPGHNISSCTNFAPSVPISNSDFKETQILLGDFVQCMTAPSTCIFKTCSDYISANHLCAKHLEEIEGKQLNPISEMDTSEWGETCDHAKTKRPDGKRESKKAKMSDPDVQDFDTPVPDINEDPTLISVQCILDYADIQMTKTKMCMKHVKDIKVKDEIWKETFEAVFGNNNTRPSWRVCTFQHVMLTVKHFNEVLNGFIDADVVHTWFRLTMRRKVNNQTVYLFDMSFFGSYVINNIQGPVGCKYNAIPASFLIENAPL